MYGIGCLVIFVCVFFDVYVFGYDVSLSRVVSGGCGPCDGCLLIFYIIIIERLVVCGGTPGPSVVTAVSSYFIF